jgi:signal transduction histidine kinase
MEAQDQQVDGMPAPEVTAALLDLTRLLHRVEFAASEAPDTIAPLLLERLVILCKAQRGALLFTTQNPAEQTHAFPASAREVKDTPQAKLQTSTRAGKTLRTLALHDMKEEVVFALLERFSSDGAAIQSPAGEPSYLLCRLPIPVPSDYRQDGGAVQSFATPDTAETRLAGLRPGQPQGHPVWGTGIPPLQMLPSYALLVLVWDAVREDSVADDDGTCLAVESAKTLLPLIMDAAGMVIMHVLLVERVHELEAVSERKALRDMELLKVELLATVSHELRSPLASIKGYAATLLRHERRISREERHEFLLAIKEASDRLAGVIDRLLEMSQLETGDITIELTAVNLAYLVREAITAVEQRLIAPEHLDRQCPLTLRLEGGRGMPTTEEPVIWADRHHLREVLDNLLENAIHYSREGGAIEITIRPIFTPDHTVMPPAQQQVQQMVEISVRDHGIGIPRVHLGRIFDRFHRVDTRLTREVNGMGLGLAICKRVVELHGGMIWAESDIGAGSTFHVWLPLDARISR